MARESARLVPLHVSLDATSSFAVTEMRARNACLYRSRTRIYSVDLHRACIRCSGMGARGCGATDGSGRVKSLGTRSVEATELSARLGFIYFKGTRIFA